MYTRSIIRVVIIMHLISGTLAIGSIIWQTNNLKKFIKEKAH